MQISVKTSIGKRRRSNQDYADFFTNNFQETLLVLCDGVGGNQAGDVASKLTTEFLGERFITLDQSIGIQDAPQWLHREIETVNQHVFQASLKDEELLGMSTTLVLVLVIQTRLFIAHVGDSRAYKYYQEQLIQLTEDHSLVNELIKSGEITPEEGLTHPIRNVVTQSIGGTPEVVYGLSELDSADVDILMLCSDGLTNMLSHETLEKAFQAFEGDLDTFTHALVEAANDAGGYDNITVMLVRDQAASEEAGGDLQ